MGGDSISGGMVCSIFPDVMSSPAMCFQAIMPDEHLIRPFQTADMSELHAIECSCQSHPWTIPQFEAEYENPVAAIDVYLWDRVVAGFLCSWFIAGELQIQNLATARDFLRKGVAVRLLGHVLERSCRAGMASAWLEVRAKNLPAIELYRKFGFKVMTQRSGYYQDGEDALIMCLQGDDN